MQLWRRRAAAVGECLRLLPMRWQGCLSGDATRAAALACAGSTEQTTAKSQAGRQQLVSRAQERQLLVRIEQATTHVMRLLP